MTDRRQFLSSIAGLIAIEKLPATTIMDVASRETYYARIVVQLTKHQWPEELGEVPDWFREKLALRGMSRYIRHVEKYNALLFGLKTLTTHREVFRVIYSEELGHSPAEFEIWWRDFGRCYAQEMESIGHLSHFFQGFVKSPVN